MLVSSLVRGGLFALKGTKGARAQAPDVDSCPGYNAVNISNTDSGLKAELVLAGSACNVYGNDYEKLSLQVTYENGFSYYNSIKSRFYNSSHHGSTLNHALVTYSSLHFLPQTTAFI